MNFSNFELLGKRYQRNIIRYSPDNSGINILSGRYNPKNHSEPEAKIDRSRSSCSWVGNFYRWS